jgi:tol-pal system protein YbgF
MIRAPALGLACAALLGIAGCASTPPEKDPVQIKLNDLDTRLARIERVVANQSLLDLANDLEAVRSEVRSLHNDVDQISNNLEAARKQQHDLYADLDRRLRVLENRGGAAAPAGETPAEGSAAAPAPSPPPSGQVSGALPIPDGSDRANYQAAFLLLKDSQYDKAISAFEQFLVAFPDSQLADNAQYWLGEAYYVNRNFTEALRRFQGVVDKYPQSAKLPDALLKIGFCDYEMKQWDQARQVLSQVAANYADTPAGRLAQQRLAKLENENH